MAILYIWHLGFSIGNPNPRCPPPSAELPATFSTSLYPSRACPGHLRMPPAAGEAAPPSPSSSLPPSRHHLYSRATQSDHTLEFPPLAGCRRPRVPPLPPELPAAELGQPGPELALGPCAAATLCHLCHPSPTLGDIPGRLPPALPAAAATLGSLGPPQANEGRGWDLLFSSRRRCLVSAPPPPSDLQRPVVVARSFPGRRRVCRARDAPAPRSPPPAVGWRERRPAMVDRTRLPPMPPSPKPLPVGLEPSSPPLRAARASMPIAVATATFRRRRRLPSPADVRLGIPPSPAPSCRWCAHRSAAAGHALALPWPVS
ncbi:vegetative cell wall protein gp1-like [Ananas comosus]|uniref:Vegetative cell wall protein gp1-like n=1 Tax=Ananas comosus TaxID=4615 RepID=A0A6P5GFS8_ANACO|nr:vegetative cell wall protein gp1-like [Ananas comosus]